MYLLYLDESGQQHGRYFVLAGAAVFERQPFWIAEKLTGLQTKYFPDVEAPIEFHASAVRSMQGQPWNKLSREQSRELLDTVYGVIAAADLTLFGVAVERDWLRSRGEEDEYAFAFESITQRFDEFLKRKFREDSNRQRGIIIVAQSEFQRRIETLAQRIIKDGGTRWGELRNLAEIPLFTSAANSRMLQVADFCANAVYGRYESGYARQFDRIAPKFDQAEGQYCGLSHFSREYETCTCPACLSRRRVQARPELPPSG
jgi:hypothetical protein